LRAELRHHTIDRDKGKSDKNADEQAFTCIGLPLGTQ
jgi:hypothetical protein